MNFPPLPPIPWWKKVWYLVYNYFNPPFSKIIFPLIRKTFPELTSHELIGVQPMNVPSSKTFYEDFKHTPHSDENCLDRDRF